jgi:hypothetical protein
MASIIKLKRSLTPSSVPGSLQEGEIAVNLQDKKLFVGGKNGGANVQILSGDLYNLTATNGSDTAILRLTVDNPGLSNDAIIFSAGEGIDISASGNTISIAGEDASTSNKGIASFNSNTFVVGSGFVSVKSSGITNAQLAGSIVNSKLTNPDIAVTANTGSAVDIPLGSTLRIVSGTAVGITTAVSANTITISGVNANYNVKGVASFSNTYFSVSSGAVTLQNSGVGAVLAINGTANEVNVSRNNGTVTVGLPDNVTITNNFRVTGNTHIDGNLTVEGAITYISSSTVNVDDSMIKLSANNSADTVDTGFYSMYIVGGLTTKYSGVFRDASDGIYKVYRDLEVEPTSTVNTGGTGYALAQLDAVIDGGTY